MQTSSSKKVIISLIVVCIVAIALTIGLAFSLFRLKQTKNCVETLTAEKAQLESTLSNVRGKFNQTQDALELEKNRCVELEKRTSELETRVQAAEEQSSSLAQQLDKLRVEIKRVKALKANSKKSATSLPPTVSNHRADGLKLIALTFDDGPSDKTARLLDELKARGMKATFFVVGNRVGRYPELLRRMVNEGHEIGNHSYSHADLTKLSTNQLNVEIQRCAQAIKATAGVDSVLMRPPYGNYNANVKNYAKEKGLRIINWSVDTRDWKSRNVNAIMATAFQSGRYGIRNGAIVLMHDVYTTTVDAAVEMMNRLAKQGYKAVTISELLQIRSGGGIAGKVYTYIG